MRSLIPRRFRLNRTGRRLAGAALAIVLIGAPVWISWESARERVAAAVGGALRDMSAGAGLVVAAVDVEGLRRTTRREVVRALGVDAGDPILGLDLDAARARIESLGWVNTARLARVLPDRITVSVTERVELAFWQLDARVQLIDRHGVPIPATDLAPFSHLPVVVGPGAGERAAGLLGMLEGEPELARLVRGATWVGGRRWNLYLGEEVVVKLPEQDPAAAWAALAELEREHSILARPIEAIDMRLPGRISVRLPGKGRKGRGTGNGLG